jgi:hypothetical protein
MEALEFLAARDHRVLSNYLEKALTEHVQERLMNDIGEFGERRDDRPWTRRVDVEAAHLRPGPHSGMRGFPPKKR